MNLSGKVAIVTRQRPAVITGQATGIGGDRLALLSHPSEIVGQQLPEEAK
ncbi:MAG: hypothetical protein ACRDNS_09175 [Trebonia sp.]